MKRKNFPKLFTEGEKAFIYQQATELNAPVLVLMDRQKDTYSVTFVIDPVNSKFQTKGEGESAIEACMQAKEKAKKKLSQLVSLYQNDEERELIVDLIKNQSLFH